MLQTFADIGTIAADLQAARTSRRAIAPPAELDALTLPEAYDVQDDGVARREAAGARQSGWKLGLTSRAKRRAMQIDVPIFGRTFADGSIISSRGAVFSGFIAPWVEAELAFGLGAPLDPNADTALLMAAVAWVAPALDITDSRYRAGRRTAQQLVADNASFGAYVIGDRVRLDAVPRLDAIGAQLIRNGSVLAAGTTADVLGDPFNALQLLARHLAERGLHARAGDIVLSGAITESFPVQLGDRFVSRLRGIGTASVVFT